MIKKIERSHIFVQRGMLGLLLFCGVVIDGRSRDKRPHTSHVNKRSAAIYNQRSAITYEVSGGRLGDNLLSLSHAAWISYLHKLNIIYKPFPLCEKFAFSHLYPSDESPIRYSFASYVNFTYRDRIASASSLAQQDVLYIVPYFPDFAPEWSNKPFKGVGHGSCCMINWNDERFMKRLSQLLSPMDHYDLPQLPSDRKCVALHVRHGGGFDPANINKAFPHKFPVIDFYIQALQFLHTEFAGEALYAYVFTDHPRPQEVVEEIARAFEGYDIIFDCREQGNHHDLNVMEDFLFMQKFPIVVRPHSNFSYMAAKLGKARIEIEPHTVFWKNNAMVIESIAVYRRGMKKVILPLHTS